MKMLQVLPNPYRSLDANGKPTAVVPCHMRHAPGEFVGATKTMVELDPAQYIDVKRVVNGKQVVEPKLAAHDRSKASFTFLTEPVALPADGMVGAYYRDRVREGALVAADPFTAQKCGVVFELPAKVLARERDAAAKQFQSLFGEMPDWANENNQAPVAAPK